MWFRVGAGEVENPRGNDRSASAMEPLQSEDRHISALAFVDATQRLFQTDVVEHLRDGTERERLRWASVPQ